MNANLDHPKRQWLLEELHARTAPRVQAPVRVIHLALKQPANAAGRDRNADLRQLIALQGSPDRNPAPVAAVSTEDSTPLQATPDPELSSDPGPTSGLSAIPAAQRRQAVFDRGGYTITWHNHTEYAGYTAVQTQAESPPFTADPDDVFPPEWESADAADRIAAVVVEVRAMPADREACIAGLPQLLDSRSICVMPVLDGEGILAGDFREDTHGFTRFILYVTPTESPGRVGRTIQHVLDLETYRSLAMIGLIRSQELSARLNRLDPRLLELVDDLDNSNRPAEEVLHELLTVTAELESLATASDFRFGATAAYNAIVEDRLAALGDDRFHARLDFREFLSRRYRPAIRTVASTERRLGRLLERSGRAAELLRTKVDVSRRAQNQALLTGMDARAETQLRLQHTVEGLSVVAISYYALGLLGYLFAPLTEALGIEKIWLMAAATPLVVLIAWLGMRWIRIRIHRSVGRRHE
ncbi:putative membrane-anchored protein [Kineosphaera limosa]|uniref:DUF3422 family protein n=1 Tax=Kineosphaera limosa TaxID=111564 RepID=UPI000318D4E8|nr:DUF3422 domain-containing protein [Kineosphaera limosa]NYD99689.1 putative membrane-anchored protein [Kineosphaera limosa]